MSFRYYRRYVYGNPQRRVFLPNFWMKLVPNDIERPSNFVQFKVPLEMTDRDIKNYLEKIYKVPVMNVRSIPRDAKFKQNKRGEMMKDGEDYRDAYVQMPVGTSFEFPDLFPKEKRKEQDDQQEKVMQQKDDIGREYDKKIQKFKSAPKWFV